jgi:hypothetical protein
MAGGIAIGGVAIAVEETGIFGQAKGPAGAGVAGFSAGEGQNAGYLGEVSYGVHGVNGAGNGPAVYGESAATAAVQGTNGGGSGQQLPTAAGVIGDSRSGHGVYGVSASSAIWRGDPQEPQGASYYSGVFGLNSSSGYGISGISESGYGVYAISYQNHAIFAQNAGGKAAVHVQGDIEVTGGVTVGGDIEVTGDVKLVGTGQDFAEEFDTAADEEIQPGTVVTIDGEDSVRESREAYDKTVAGVVSGAGAYRPGIILGKLTAASIPVQVGLVGKVYCKVDAQYGPIKVGDLLTTSSTPGHAMRAADSARAFGAVLGKALRNHDAGCGLIPILLALQ